MPSEDQSRQRVRRMPNRRMLQELAPKFGMGKLQVEAFTDDPPKEDGGEAEGTPDSTTRR